MKHRVNRKVLRRILSLLFVMTMLVMELNLDKMVESVYATQKTEDNQKNEVTIIRELVNERTEKSNTYLMSNGSKEFEILGET